MSGRDVVRELREGGALGKPAGDSGNALDMTLGIIAAIAVGCCILVGFGWFNGSQPPAGSAAPAMLSVADSGDLVWTAADSARCEARGRAAANEDVPDEFMMADPVLSGGGFARLATLVACRATTKVARLCNGEQKAEFIAAVNDYIMRFDIILTALNVQGAPMAIAGELWGGEAQFGSQVYQDQKQDTIGYLKIYHKRVVTGLQGLARADLVSTTDFGTFLGMGVSSTITNALDGIAPHRKICA